MEREYVNFGKGGVMVTRMALGLGFRGQNDAAEAKKTISAALDGGLNLIDCANIYGLGDSRRNAGTSETILGELMKDRGDRDEIVITSKVSSPVAPGINDHNTSRWHLMREVERSLKRLQTDRIDVYLIHHFDETVGYEERTRALEDLVGAGKIRYTGVCNYQAWQVVQTLRVQDRINAGSLITVQNPYSMLNRELEDEMFPMVRATGLGIMAYSPLAVGLLSGDYVAGRIPDSATIWGSRRSHAFDRVARGAAAEVIRTNAEVAKRIGATPAQVAQAWVLSHPEITVAISGADTEEQMQDNLGSLAIELPAEALAKLNAASHRLRIVLDGAGFEGDR
jgi:aryl-alcohol dehydrogenase-like predicted oxidoreductase